MAPPARRPREVMSSLTIITAVRWHGTLVGIVLSACGVAFDGAPVYRGEADGGTVGCANLDGTGINHALITATYGPCGVAVDSAHVTSGHDRLSR